MTRTRSFRKVPPAPHVMAQLYADYKRATKGLDVSFRAYLQIIGLAGTEGPLPGRDAGTNVKASPGLALVSVPRQPIVGALNVVVLLVDFADNVGKRHPREFQDMLFADKAFLTGSLADYYREVSRGKVTVEGSVHGWFRMPQAYSSYVGGDSGTGSYPHNAQRLAEHALEAALAEKVAFPPSLDKLGNGTITALVVVHAGPGAENETAPAMQQAMIWSHKADLRVAVRVADGLYAASYLTVPEDCRMGVCAHELGHLAFQWDDFYDPNYDRDGSQWDGAGVWDLMAGGSWNGGGNTPAHPAGLHKIQHGWVPSTTVSKTTQGLRLPPYGDNDAVVVRVKGPDFSSTQCLVLENRVRKGFDAKLPGEGLLVWRVDTSLEMNSARKPAMLLIQADGRHDLEEPGDYNDGDASDPFPTADRDSLPDQGDLSTSFPGQPRSGIRLSGIKREADGSITLDVEI